MSFRAEAAGRAALAALGAGSATVFAAFERSCYVETPTGIACLGGAGLGMGPLNVALADFAAPSIGDIVELELDALRPWEPPAARLGDGIPVIEIPGPIRREAEAFLAWLQDRSPAADTLIGLGPGLTPAGDDFVAGAMIALRASGRPALADRVADWALPLARARTGRISRAHLECAANGEGHEALHRWLASPDERNLAQLAQIGHTSGLDAAAGAAAALQVFAERPAI